MIGSQEATFYALTMGSAGAAAVGLYPLVSRFLAESSGRFERYRDVKVQRATDTLDDIFVEVKPKWLKVAYGVVPLAAGLALFALSENVWLALAGTMLGLLVPDFWIKQHMAMRRRQFRAQLVDALLMLSSGLRAGLSIT